MIFSALPFLAALVHGLRADFKNRKVRYNNENNTAIF